MEPHQTRVVDELKELETKRGNLGKLIGQNPVFATLPVAEQGRLKRQFDIMLQYEAILSERIAAFPKK